MQGFSLPQSLDVNLLFLAGAWLFLALLFAVVVFALVRGVRARARLASQLARLSDLSERLGGAQANLQGRMELTQAGLNERLDALAKRVGDSFQEQGERTGDSLRVLHERLAVIDAAQKNIAQLTGQVGRLQDVLSNKQARGAFGEVQLNDLIVQMLPASAYDFQVTLGNRARADCLLRLPDPPGPLVIDAKFPLESYRALREAADEAARVRARRSFAADVVRHVRDIAERYIVPGETADSALMFLPSEAVYAELHAGFRNVVEESFRRKVWIVSPTTLWATLNTVRAILRDVHLRAEAGRIQVELRALADDIGRVDERARRLQRHFEGAQEDVRGIRTAADRVRARAGRLDVGGIAADADAPTPFEAGATAPPGAH
jgi:DNA recombination protein RmuC